MGDEERATLDGPAFAALVLAIIAWMSFLVAFLLADDPFFFLFLALVAGVIAFVLSFRARRTELAAAAAGATAASAALVYGVTLMALLSAMVYATGVLLLLVLLLFLFAMQAPRASGGGSGCTCSDCDCSGCACDCGCDDCCDCGDCDCGSCCDCGDCGGCGCVGFPMPPPALAHVHAQLPPLGFRERVARVLRRGIAHHPDAPEYRADVYLIRGARWCIGCFTTYPVFLAASAWLALAPPALAWSSALGLGAALAAAQLVSSAGFARWRAVKALVKTCLGLGLALAVHGIHAAPWHPAWKVAALLATLLLALASTIPRTIRMRRARRLQHEACACAATTTPAP